MFTTTSINPPNNHIDGAGIDSSKNGKNKKCACAQHVCVGCRYRVFAPAHKSKKKEKTRQLKKRSRHSLEPVVTTFPRTPPGSHPWVWNNTGVFICQNYVIKTAQSSSHSNGYFRHNIIQKQQFQIKKF